MVVSPRLSQASWNGKNNIFGCLTFESFGFFWISFASILMLPAHDLAGKPSAPDIAAFLVV